MRCATNKTVAMRCAIEETIPTRSVIERFSPMRVIGKRVVTQPSSLNRLLKRHSVTSEEECMVKFNGM